jgi:hypothetical protein
MFALGPGVVGTRSDVFLENLEAVGDEKMSWLQEKR